jgi:hypothetical protein
MVYKDPKIAFSNAIKTGVLVTDKSRYYYVGNYMYMGTNDQGIDQFKNVFDRSYIDHKKSEKL